MPGTIRLNNDTEFSGTAVDDEGILWLDFDETTLATVCPFLIDESNVSTVTVQQYGTEYIYEGFTHLFYIRETNGTKVSAGLEKGEQ